MSIKDKLTEKIVSEADLANAMGFYRAEAVAYTSQQSCHLPWWVMREKFRVQHGVYPAHTDVTRELAGKLPWTGLHISKEDPNQIAYTVDRANGEADRQVRTTLGRFLQKYYPFLPDDKLQNLVAEHVAEASTDLELLTGAELTAVYQSGAAGGCMSHPNSHWSTLDGHHPSEAYWAPDIAMAVLRAADGKVSGRAMVYTPSPDDKRYIRAYGSPALVKKLQRLGYRAGTWTGAKFNKIELAVEVHSEAKRLVMPYLDGNGSQGGAGTSTVALLDGELVCVTESVSKLMNKAATGSAITCTNTSGYQDFLPVKAEAYVETCALTGRTAFVWEGKMSKAYFDGKLTTVLTSEIAFTGPEAWIAGRYLGKGVAFKPDTPAWGYHNYVDTLENREYEGYYKLSSKYYPDQADEWFTGNDVEKSEEGYLFTKDIVWLVQDEGTTAKVHKSGVQKSWTALAPLDGTKAFAVSGKNVLRTASKKKVVRNFHDIVRLWDGSWDFARNCVSLSVYRMTLRVARKERLTQARAMEEHVVQHYMETSTDLLTTVTHVCSREMLTAQAVDGRLLNMRTEKFTLEDALRGAVRVGSLELQRFLTKLICYAADATALDYNCPDAQGGSANTWTPPAEVPDENGLLFSDILQVRTKLPTEEVWLRWLELKDSDFLDNQDFVETFVRLLTREMAGEKLKAQRQWMERALLEKLAQIPETPVVVDLPATEIA